MKGIYMKRKILTICVAVFFFLIAIWIMLYPMISNAYNAKHHSELFTDYERKISHANALEIEQSRNDAIAYNQSLSTSLQMIDPFSKESLQAAFDAYSNLLNLNGSEIMGYIDIPAIEVHLPIFHGTEDKILQKGVGHLLGSSMPVGGESTHTILTGHSGMASQRMFTDLPQLKIGDVIYLHILDEVLAYQVYDTAEVLPHNTSKLQIESNRDLCTLITCTPIGINTHRLLVMAERIPYEEAEEIVEEIIAEDQPESTWEQNYIKGIIIGIGIVMVIVFQILAIWLFLRCHNLKIRIAIVVVMILIFIAGLVVLLYPTIHGARVDRQLEWDANEFLDRTGEDDIPTPIEPTETEPEDETMPTEASITREYEELWHAMNMYNESIWNNKQAGLSDPWSYTQPSFTLGDFGLEDEIFGVITIPALDLEMPIYLGATNSHLAAGAAQLSQTSIPIGGNNTNSVIAGHRGYSGASYFRYVPDLKIGDKVIITNLWEELTYVVVDTDIIAPNEVEKVLIQEGRDMITLITCHPYASGGKQRFVIYCERES